LQIPVSHGLAPALCIDFIYTCDLAFTSLSDH
jgi:hypothetical protein